MARGARLDLFLTSNLSGDDAKNPLATQDACFLRRACLARECRNARRSKTRASTVSPVKALPMGNTTFSFSGDPRPVPGGAVLSSPLDPNGRKLLFSMSTICAEQPPASDEEASASVILHEDLWRQSEFFF